MVLKFGILCAISIVLTLILTISVFYNIFKKQMIADLAVYIFFLEDNEYLDRLNSDRELFYDAPQRVTVIEPSGKVIYDSKADIWNMDNHMDRQEVIDALKYGNGSAVRHSETKGLNTFYYAKLMSDNNILRVCIDSKNAFAIFIDMIPFVVIMSLLIFTACIFMANFLTKQILKPIKGMTLDVTLVEGREAYEEFIPLYDIINEQHENIRQKVQELEKSSLMRQEFTANVSHELKTPVTIISGYAELMESGMIKETDVKRFSGEIRSSANRLIRLINDIIQLSELDSKEIEIYNEEFYLSRLIHQCVDKLRIKAEQLKVDIIVKTDKECIITANKNMIEEMVNNLCDNAIRYNKEGGMIRVTILEEGFIVEDTGIGIPKEHLERVFERFYRVDKSRSKATGGTGLGLAIVKHIAEKNNAVIKLDSIEGEGTRIFISFNKNANKVLVI